MSCMGRRECAVCGSTDINWCISDRFDLVVYCSVACSLMGPAFLNLVLAIIGFVVSALMIIFRFGSEYFSGDEFPIVIGFVGFFTLLFAFLSAIGFRLRKTRNYERLVSWKG